MNIYENVIDVKDFELTRDIQRHAKALDFTMF